MPDMDHDLNAEPAAETPPPPHSTPRKMAARRGLESQDDVPHHAVARTVPDRVAKALERAAICARICDDNRAKDIVVLDLRQATPLLDFFVIATAATRRQANSIAIEIDVEMKKIQEYKLGMEGTEEGSWILIDYGDFVVHLFIPEARAYYGLEEIWGDAPRLDWRDPSQPLPPTRAVD
jgi:ribosome-associated protein